MVLGLMESSEFVRLTRLILGVLILITFGLSFLKHKYIPAVSFIILAAIGAFLCYATADEKKLHMPIYMSNIKQTILAVTPIIFLILAIVSVALWFKYKRNVARGLVLISIAVAIFIHFRV